MTPIEKLECVMKVLFKIFCGILIFALLIIFIYFAGAFVQFVVEWLNFLTGWNIH